MPSLIFSTTARSVLNTDHTVRKLFIMTTTWYSLLLLVTASIVAGDDSSRGPAAGGSKTTSGGDSKSASAGGSKAGSTGASSGAGGSAAHGGQAGPTTADMENAKYYLYLAVILASIVGALFVYHMVTRLVRYVRTITCLNNDTQRYFAVPNDAYAKVKEHVLYAPLFGNRRNRESTRKLDFGVLPTRFQSLLLAAYTATNIAFCVLSIDWRQSQTTVLAQFRNRTGILAMVNLVPIFLMAGRNNPLIKLLDVSFDTFNLMHRWFGRIVVLETICHTAAYTTSKVKTTGWASVGAAIHEGDFILGGLIGAIAAVVILLQSPAVVRHAFYETFLHLHRILALLFVIGVWLHLEQLPQMKLLLGAIGLWIAERSVRMIRLIYRNWGPGGSKALVETLPGDALRVTLNMARPWTLKPGQHMFLYVPSVGLWMSHPFSIAWSEEQHLAGEKGMSMDRQEMRQAQKTSMSLIVRRRTGFTEKLFQKAQLAKGKMVVTAYAEGPYGGIQDLESYGTVMMFAGGVGITHQVPYVRQLVEGFATGTVAARKVVLVWIIQSPEHLEWIRPWMTTILAMERRRDVLRILLFVTRPRSTREIHSPSATVQMFPGKPNVETLVTMEAETQIGAMGVTVCGPGSLSDDVRGAVRRQQRTNNIDFVEASYSW